MKIIDGHVHIGRWSEVFLNYESTVGQAVEVMKESGVSSAVALPCDTFENEKLLNDILNQNAEAKGRENKPNYTNREFMNALIIFQTALMDKMWDNQDYDKMQFKDRENMAVQCGLDLRKLIHTYTGLDTHKIEDFL